MTSLPRHRLCPKLALLDSSARQHAGKGFGVVVTTLVYVDVRSPSEFRRQNDKGFVEHAPLGQVVQESRKSLIQDRGSLGNPVKLFWWVSHPPS